MVSTTLLYLQCSPARSALRWWRSAHVAGNQQVRHEMRPTGSRLGSRKTARWPLDRDCRAVFAAAYLTRPLRPCLQHLGRSSHLTLTAVSSMTNDVCRLEFSVPVNLSVTAWPA